MELCTNCGAANSLNSAKCFSCSASLDEEDHRVIQEPETSRFDQFAAQAQAYHAGELTRRDFGQWVQGTRDLMNGKREDYVEVVREGELEDVNFEGVQTLECLSHLEYQQTDYLDQREVEVTTAMEGMLQMEAAMDCMLEFASDETSEDSVLVRALQEMWAGNQKCNQAIQMNREFREELFQVSV